MELLRVDTLEEARAKLGEYCRIFLMKTKSASLESMFGAVLAEDICASENIPPYRRSAMDGYAVRSADVGAASDAVPSFLKLDGEVLMGRMGIAGEKQAKAAKTDVLQAEVNNCNAEPQNEGLWNRTPGCVQSGCCVYVPTGGWVPDGADAVVMTEYCETFGDGMLAVSKPAAPGENVVQTGEDMACGEIVLQRGRKLKPQDTGVLAALGVTSAQVYKPWNITVISTGDELVEPKEAPEPGQMRDINTYTIAARSAVEGFRVVGTRLIKDDEEALHDALEKAKAESDVVVISGGSSQGKKDMTAELIGRAADSGVLTHGIAAKPGKPTITGFDRKSSTLFVGLPGHPAAALIVFEQLVIKLWRELTGQPEERTVKARVSMNVPSSPGRRTFQLVKLESEMHEGIDLNAGCPEVVEAIPVFARSGMISPLSRAEGYFEIGENREGVRAGEMVTVHLWS